MLLRKAAKDCIFRLKLRNVMAMLKNVENEMKNTDPNSEDFDHLMQEKIHLDTAKKAIAKYFGTVIL